MLDLNVSPGGVVSVLSVCSPQPRLLLSGPAVNERSHQEARLPLPLWGQIGLVALVLPSVTEVVRERAGAVAASPQLCKGPQQPSSPHLIISTTIWA